MAACIMTQQSPMLISAPLWLIQSLLQCMGGAVRWIPQDVNGQEILGDIGISIE